MSPNSPRPQPSAAVVYQPFKTNITELKAAVATYEARAGWAPTQWFETDEDDSGVAATKRALESGASVVLGSGGDGTIRAISEALRGTRVPLAVIPEGTGNLLARNLGIPLSNTEEAVRGAFFGNSRPIDLGVMRIIREDESEDEHVFLVLAGMGLDARLISTTNTQMKRRLGWLAYVDAGARSLIRDKPLQIHYSMDGSEPRPLSVYSLMIGNCGLMPGGVLLIPDAKIDDGRLDVVALRPTGAFSWLRIWRALSWENGVLRKSKTGRKVIDLVRDTKSVTYLRAKKFALSVNRPEPIQLDGDDFGKALTAVGRVDPGALHVRVLPEWDSQL